MQYQHPRYPRIFFVAGETHPAVKPMAEQRRPAYEALKQELKAHGYYASANEVAGDMWIEALGEYLPFYEARKLIEERK